jgi:hypothetical protein
VRSTWASSSTLPSFCIAYAKDVLALEARMLLLQKWESRMMARRRIMLALSMEMSSTTHLRLLDTMDEHEQSKCDLLCIGRVHGSRYPRGVPCFLSFRTNFCFKPQNCGGGRIIVAGKSHDETMLFGTWRFCVFLTSIYCTVPTLDFENSGVFSESLASDRTIVRADRAVNRLSPS